jgi:hypothetical protein
VTSRTVWKALGLAAIVASALGLALGGKGDPPTQYRATIVDAASETPLAGAVLTVVWCTYPWGTMDHGYTFHTAKEAVSDSQGRVSMNTRHAIDWNPFTREFQPRLRFPWSGISRSTTPLDSLYRRIS